MAKHKQEDPWAGFVDVLSNILMVVVFLVVILGISIFALSQQITKAAVDRAVKAERASQAQAETAPPPAEPVKEQVVSSAAAPTTAAPSTSQPIEHPGKATQLAGGGASTASNRSQSVSEGEKGADGVYEAAHGLRTRQADDLAGNTNMSVRSSKVDDVKSIQVASEEASAPNGPVEIKSSQAFITLKYGRGAFKIDPAAATELQSFLSASGIPKNGKIEIRAFAQSTVGSVSEARRIAYYRAMQVRTELIKQGVDASRVELKLRESYSPEELDVVRVYAKPS